MIRCLPFFFLISTAYAQYDLGAELNAARAAAADRGLAELERRYRAAIAPSLRDVALALLAADRGGPNQLLRDEARRTFGLRLWQQLMTLPAVAEGRPVGPEYWLVLRAINEALFGMSTWHGWAEMVGLRRSLAPLAASVWTPDGLAQANTLMDWDLWTMSTAVLSEFRSPRDAPWAFERASDGHPLACRPTLPAHVRSSGSNVGGCSPSTNPPP